MRLAVVGVGIAGTSHLLDAVCAPGVDVVAVCAGHGERAREAADRFGVSAWYADFDRLLSDEIADAVIVATPPAVLARQAVAALEHGLDVLVEKPMATSRDELRRLAHAEGCSAGTLVVGYTRRYRRAWAQAREWIAAGAIGELLEADFLRREPYRDRYRPGAETYRSSPRARVGGVLLDSGSHALDALAFATGHFGRVVEAEVAIDPDGGADVEARVVLEGPAAERMTLELTHGDGEDGERALLRGTSGEIEVRGASARLTTATTSVEVADCYIGRPVDDLVRIVAGEPPRGAPLGDAARIVEQIVEAYAAAGRPLRARWQRPRAKALARLSGAC